MSLLAQRLYSVSSKMIEFLFLFIVVNERDAFLKCLDITDL
jgi:hypothetical protein